MPSGVESLAPVQARGVGRVQRHHALTAACLMDNGLPLDASPVLSIVLDTPASGDDGTLWGGEFLLAEYGRFRRLGTFRPIACPGRHMDASQPWQTLLAHILAQMGWPTFAMNYAELELFAFLSARIEARPADQVDLRSVSSACAPWFDAVAAAMGLCRLNLEYPGQSIAELEAAVDRDCLENEDDALSYPFAIPRLPNGLPYVEPLACWQALFGDLLLDTPLGVMAARFHRGLAKTLVRMADRLIREAGREGAPIANIALIGRVFQNRILFSCVESQLQALGHVVLGHAQTACHDDSVLVGRTLVAAARQMGTN